MDLSRCERAAEQVCSSHSSEEIKEFGDLIRAVSSLEEQIKEIKSDDRALKFRSDLTQEEIEEQHKFHIAAIIILERKAAEKSHKIMSKGLDLFQNVKIEDTQK